MYELGDIVKRTIYQGDIKFESIGQIVYLSPIILWYVHFNCYVGVFDNTEIALLQKSDNIAVRPPPQHVIKSLSEKDIPTGHS